MLKNLSDVRFRREVNLMRLPRVPDSCAGGYSNAAPIIAAVAAMAVISAIVVKPFQES